MEKQKEQIELHNYPPNAFKRQKKTKNQQQRTSYEEKQTKSKDNQAKNSFRQQQSLNTFSDPMNQQIKQQDNQSEQSQLLELEKQAQDIVNQINKRQQIQKGNDKVVVGSGFSFDITQFFKFQKKKQLDSKEGDIFSEISGSVIAWVILLYSVLNSAMIPSWIMNIKATKLLRISWRFLLQSLMILPFVLYERRSANQQAKKQYSLRHIINPVHLKKVYISSIATTIWFTCVLTVFQWTYVSHGLVLGSMSNFFLSIHRSMTGSQHSVQPGGRYLVVLGILLVMYDSYIVDNSSVADFRREVVNPFYLDREWWQRILADLVALGVSFTLSKISRYTADMKSHYPPYLSMFLVNIFLTINMFFTSYFFNGVTFDNDIRFGFFSIFTQQHFAGFLYMSIVLCFGMFVSFVLISKLFPDPIIPALAMTLDPILGTILLQWTGIQFMPQAYSFIGYLLIVPGLIMILIGQCLYQRSKSKLDEQRKQNEKSEQILRQLRQLRQLKSIEHKRVKLKRAKTLKRVMESQRQNSQRQIKSPQTNQAQKYNSKTSLYDPLIEREHQVPLSRKASLDDVQNDNKKQ